MLCALQGQERQPVAFTWQVPFTLVSALSQGQETAAELSPTPTPRWLGDAATHKVYSLLWDRQGGGLVIIPPSIAAASRRYRTRRQDDEERQPESKK